jgi:mannosyl-3-phosphoglycerate phosphatase
LLQKVLFTDIDGTMTDIMTGKYGTTKALVRKLKAKNVPVVLCSAKTRAEQVEIRRQMSVRDPFVVENGGAIIIPKNYFRSSSMAYKNTANFKNYILIELGKPAPLVRRKLNKIRKKFKIEFTGVADVSIKQLSYLTGLTAKSAGRMANREYGETILSIEHKDAATLSRMARGTGLKVIHGGRYMDVTLGNDKGKAVDILLSLFRREYGNNVIFFGIGDSLNDVPMLRHMDVPMLVQRPDGSWPAVKIKNISNLEGIGPNGWQNAVNKIMDTKSKE